MIEIKAQIYDLFLQRNKLIEQTQAIERKIQELEKKLNEVPAVTE
jgi:chaperonin cofactor prefoldin